jgi:hypothetical protein
MCNPGHLLKAETKQNIPYSEHKSSEIENIGNIELEIDDLQKRKKDIVTCTTLFTTN